MFVQIGGQKNPQKTPQKQKKRGNLNIKRQEAKQGNIWKYGSKPLLDLVQMFVNSL